MMEIALSFDDVMMVPQHSNIESRSEVDIGVGKWNHPFVPANMRSISGPKMCRYIASTGGLALMHRFCPVEEQLEFANSLTEYEKSHIGFSFGVKEEDKHIVTCLSGAGIKILCLDIAHADSYHTINMIKWLKSWYPCFLIAGNVATPDGANRLWNAGADMVKASIGGGSICSTRMVTGNGVPTLQAIMNISKHNPWNKYLMADGGMRNSGDVCKALAFADMVMLGNMFSGTDEAEGGTRYEGSSTHKSNRVEGVKSTVQPKGPASNVLRTLTEGLESCCSYQGVRNLKELRRDAQFVRITQAGYRESTPHINT